MVRGVLPLVFSSGRLHSRRRTQTDRICTSRLNTSISGGDAVSPSASCLVRLLELMARYPVKVIKIVPAVEEINKRVKQRLMRISNSDCPTEIKPKREKNPLHFPILQAFLRDGNLTTKLLFSLSSHSGLYSPAHHKLPPRSSPPHHQS